MNATRTMMYRALLLFGGIPSLAAGTLTLKGSLQQLPNSFEWQSADLTYAAAGQSLNAARAATGLSLPVGGDVQAGVAVIGSTQVSAGTTAASLNVSSSASLALLPWSAAFDGVHTATRSLNRAAFDLRDTRNTQAINLSQAYQNARIAQLDANNVRSSETVVAQQLEVAKLTTLQATQNLQLSRTQLWNAIGATDASETLESAKALPLTLRPLETLIQTALTQRVDVQKAVARVGDAEDALNIATRIRLLPSGSVGLSLGQGSGGTGILGNLGINTGKPSVTGSTPLTAAT